MKKNGSLILILAAVSALTTGTAFAQGTSVYSAFPDGDPGSGRFVNLVRGAESLGEGSTRLAISSPGSLSSFTIQIFDADNRGLWDAYADIQQDNVRWTLFADPTASGATDPGRVVNTFLADDATNGNTMDDQWTTITVVHSTDDPHGADGANLALGADGKFHYTLQVAWVSAVMLNPKTTKAGEINSFKVRVLGEVYAFGGSTYGFIGYNFEPTLPLIQPNGAVAFPRPTTYDGHWHFDLERRGTAISVLNLWNGDFDRADDTNDVHSVGIPAFAYDQSGKTPAKEQGVNVGNPADDGGGGPGLTFSPAIYLTLSSDDYGWTVTDSNPSGNQEWENFRIGTDPADLTSGNIDALVPALPVGHYHFEMWGVDARNTLFLHADSDTYAEPGDYAIGDRVFWDADGFPSADDLSEPGINGVTVNLYLKNGVDPAGQPVWEFYGRDVTRTVPNLGDWQHPLAGFYRFDYLPSGEYKVVVDTASLSLAGTAAVYDRDLGRGRHDLRHARQRPGPDGRGLLVHPPGHGRRHRRHGVARSRTATACRRPASPASPR